jgi:hypothetical protein
MACALLLSSCGGDSGDSAPSGAETAQTAGSGPTTPEAIPLAGGPLEPGTYTFDGFEQPLTFTVGEGWEALIQEGQQGEAKLGAFFALLHQDHPAANLAFIETTRVVDPAKDWDEEGNVVPLPDDLVAWFAEHPYLEAEEPFETSLGTLPARAVDVYVARVPRNGWPSCGGQCVLWFPLSVDQEDGPLTPDDLVFGGANEEYDRQIVADVGGQPFVADIGALKQNAFERFVPVAEEVLATVQIG